MFMLSSHPSTLPLIWTKIRYLKLIIWEEYIMLTRVVGNTCISSTPGVSGSFRDSRSSPYMPVKCRCCRQRNKAASIDQYRWYCPYRLEQDACERKSNGVATEDDETKDAVDPSLQLVWN